MQQDQVLVSSQPDVAEVKNVSKYVSHTTDVRDIS